MEGDGRRPDHHQGQWVIAGRRWLQLSYHVDPRDWRPDADLGRSTTLVDYLHGALTRFEFAVALHNAGLDDVEITETHRVHEHAGSAIIRARKPA